MEIQHQNDQQGGLFFIEEGGKKIATMSYFWSADKVFTIDHTIVDPSQEGKGVGKLLVQAAVDFARKEHYTIIPVCTYAKHVLTKSDAFADVLN